MGKAGKAFKMGAAAGQGLTPWWPHHRPGAKCLFLEQKWGLLGCLAPPVRSTSCPHLRFWLMAQLSGTWGSVGRFVQLLLEEGPGVVPTCLPLLHEGLVSSSLQVGQHGAQLLASMINGLDDKDDPHNLVALEAMTGLSKLLAFTEERDVHSMLLHIAIRIRPFFDSVRMALFPGSSRGRWLDCRLRRREGGRDLFYPPPPLASKLWRGVGWGSPRSVSGVWGWSVGLSLGVRLVGSVLG